MKKLIKSRQSCWHSMAINSANHRTHFPLPRYTINAPQKIPFRTSTIFGISGFEKIWENSEEFSPLCTFNEKNGLWHWPNFKYQQMRIRCYQNISSSYSPEPTECSRMCCLVVESSEMRLNPWEQWPPEKRCEKFAKKQGTSWQRRRRQPIAARVELKARPTLLQHYHNTAYIIGLKVLRRQAWPRKVHLSLYWTEKRMNDSPGIFPIRGREWSPQRCHIS